MKQGHIATRPTGVTSLLLSTCLFEVTGPLAECALCRGVLAVLGIVTLVTTAVANGVRLWERSLKNAYKEKS